MRVNYYYSCNYYAMLSQIALGAVTGFLSTKTFEEVKASLPEGFIIKEQKNGLNGVENLFLMTVDKSADEAVASTELYCQANGLVFEKGTNRLVCANHNKLRDINTTEEMYNVLSNYNCIHSNYHVYTDKLTRMEYCEDGTIMRLYNYNGNWLTATTRCLDARNSYWSTQKTFDEMFWETFGDFKQVLPNLDPEYTYVFVLLHKDNRIVVKHLHNALVYVSRINNNTREEDFKNVFYNFDERKMHGEQWNIRRPRVLPALDLQALEKAYFPIKRGIICKLYNEQTEHWDIYKFDYEQYRTIKALRGNVAHIELRYLELEPEQQKAIEQFYPEYKKSFSIIKQSMMKLVKTIHKSYVDSHIKHTITVTEDDIYYRTLRQLHAQYKTTNKPISYEDVQNKLNSLDKNTLHKLISTVH